MIDLFLFYFLFLVMFYVLEGRVYSGCLFEFRLHFWYVVRAACWLLLNIKRVVAIKAEN